MVFLERCAFIHPDCFINASRKDRLSGRLWIAPCDSKWLPNIVSVTSLKCFFTQRWGPIAHFQSAIPLFLRMHWVKVFFCLPVVLHQIHIICLKGLFYPALSEDAWNQITAMGSLLSVSLGLDSDRPQGTRSANLWLNMLVSDWAVHFWNLNCKVALWEKRLWF